jgi:hypothetical protein
VSEPHIVSAVCTESSGIPPEVIALYATEKEAQRHVADSYWMVRATAMPLYETYDDLPDDEKGHAQETWPSTPAADG